MGHKRPTGPAAHNAADLTSACVLENAHTPRHAHAATQAEKGHRWHVMCKPHQRRKHDRRKARTRHATQVVQSRQVQGWWLLRATRGKECADPMHKCPNANSHLPGSVAGVLRSADRAAGVRRECGSCGGSAVGVRIVRRECGGSADRAGGCGGSADGEPFASCGFWRNGGGVPAVNFHARTANMNTPARGGGVVPVHTLVARIVFVEILDTRSYSRTKVQCL